MHSCVDATLDKAITPNSDQYIVWAVGPRGTEDGLAYYHTQRTPNLQTRLRFGRTAADNCAALSCPSPSSCPYAQETFDVTNMDATFAAEIGQSGGPRGYEGITGVTRLLQILDNSSSSVRLALIVLRVESPPPLSATDGEVSYGSLLILHSGDLISRNIKLL